MQFEAWAARRNDYGPTVPIEPDQAARTGGHLAEQISTRFVQLIKAHGDRGPTKCRTYIDDDLIIVLMCEPHGRRSRTRWKVGSPRRSNFSPVARSLHL